MLKKKLPSKDTIEAWTYEEEIYTGISVGVFDRAYKRSQAVVSVENVKRPDGIDARIVINKAKAENYGFEIIIDET